MACPTRQLTQQLIEQDSVTPNDKNCQAILGERLKAMHFTLKNIHCEGVNNLWACLGDSGPLLVFAGHTDVVPPGPLTDWHTPPFQAVEKNGCLYGRGAADMKGSLAAMIVACERFLKVHPKPRGRIAFMITSDEEGPATHGTRVLVDYCKKQGIKPDYCIIGEPSSSLQLGDTLKIGRRGSLHGAVVLQGIQGHIAYPHLAKNPIHKGLQTFDALSQLDWRGATEHFPATSFQWSRIHADSGASNMTPATLTGQFNLRFSPAHTVSFIKETIHSVLLNCPLPHTITWHLSAQPFYTPPSTLVDACQQALRSICQIETALSTSGGTSDGRFIQELGPEMVELGPINSSIHQANEHVNLRDLAQLTQVYQHVLHTLLAS